MALQLLRKARKTSLSVERRCGTSQPKRQLTSREVNSSWQKATCQRTCASSCNKRRCPGIQSRSSDRNAGENKKLVTLAHSKEWKLETNFENTARKTPAAKSRNSPQNAAFHCKTPQNAAKCCNLQKKAAKRRKTQQFAAKRRNLPQFAAECCKTPLNAAKHAKRTKQKFAAKRRNLLQFAA